MLSMIACYGTAIGFLIMGIGLTVDRYSVKQSTPEPIKVVTASGDVTSLVERLRPLAKDPDGEWYSNGIAVQFSGKNVSIKLKTENGNEYNAAAKTLDEAVANLSKPSSEIAKALDGWKPAP